MHPAAVADPVPAVNLPPPAATVSERIDLGADAPAAPRIRIGLRSDPMGVRVGATSGRFVLRKGGAGEEVCAARAEGPVLLVTRGGRRPGRERVFQVQVGAYRNEAAARDEGEQLERQFREIVEVVPDPSRGVFRVRVGRAQRAADLQELLASLRAAGLDGAWIVSTPKAAPAGSPAELLAFDERWDSCPIGTDRVVVVPAGGRVTVDGRPYRGLVEVLISDAGDLTVVNEVNLEDYLLGVVPEELGPSQFPELEALEAQAIAARTYALANLGQYSADGFDLCDTPRCQVYGGVASEHRLSGEAVRRTAGEVLVHEGRLIAALFTSTCGGVTEDVAVVFPEMLDASAYLRSVPCRPDAEALSGRVIRIVGRPSEGRTSGAGESVTLAALVADGILPRESLDPGWELAPASGEEVSRWGAALAERAGLAPATGFGDVAARLEVWRWLSSILGFGTGSAGCVAPGDEAFVLPTEDRKEIPPGDRLWVANLLARGLAPPRGDARLRPFEPAMRADVIDFLVRAADALDAVPLREAFVRQRSTDGLIVREGRVTRLWRVDAGKVDLYMEVGGRWRPVSVLELLPGDRLIAAGGADSATPALLGLRERKGAADDRTSPKFRWVIARDRDFIETRLADWNPVGRLLDLAVLRRGQSGRVAEVELRGEGGVARVDGFRLRTALDLPETLFDVEIQRESDGAVRRVVFVGRGWGHGVGLCQYGAFGMALRGADHREILSHYYRGAQLVRIPARSE